MSNRLRYASDLHIELMDNFKETTEIVSLWDFVKEEGITYYLALVGDIGNPMKHSLYEFLQLISPQYERIYYVPGNHEYYNLDYPEKTKTGMDQILIDLCQKFSNILYFNNRTDYIGNIKLIGTTLWSNVPDYLSRKITRNINDYHLIKKNDLDDLVSITTDDTNLWNKNSVEFIKHEVDENYKCIILTHHAPLYSDEDEQLYTANPIYMYSDNNDAFHNDLANLIKSPIIAWIYGHTHYVNIFEYNGVTIATNQLGYSHESTYKTFDPHKYIFF